MKLTRGNYEKNQSGGNSLTNPLKSLDKFNTGEFYKFLHNLNAKIEIGESYNL